MDLSYDPFLATLGLADGNDGEYGASLESTPFGEHPSRHRAHITHHNLVQDETEIEANERISAGFDWDAVHEQHSYTSLFKAYSDIEPNHTPTSAIGTYSELAFRIQNIKPKYVAHDTG
jgi:hypothetical protein